jgi:3-phosphoshikimate 1-carboxyvinyltransferase
VKIEPAASLEGHFAVPGDKSISHRALLLGAVSDGTTTIRGFGRSGDTESTLGAVRALGAVVDDEGDELVVHGVGLRGLKSATIDCGNAGTLARLIVGLLAFQDGTFTLTGDESLSARPMERIAEPLRRMGAQIETTEGHLPLTVTGSRLTGIEYALPVASAQIKSAVLLAGLGAEGKTTVIEPAPTRDHTELMLRAAGARVTTRPTSASVDGTESIQLGAVEVPGDFSSAAPFIVAASLVPSTRAGRDCSTCSTAWAPASGSSSEPASAPSRRGRSRCEARRSLPPRSRAARCRSSSTSCRSSPSSLQVRAARVGSTAPASCG